MSQRILNGLYVCSPRDWIMHLVIDEHFMARATANTDPVLQVEIYEPTAAAIVGEFIRQLGRPAA